MKLRTSAPSTPAAFRRRTPVPRWADLATQVALLGMLIMLYARLRIWVEGSESAARTNADRILDMEATVGLDVELALQERVLEHAWLVDVFNFVYTWLYWVSVAIALALLWWIRRERYVVLRNALIAAAAIGLMLFWVFPVAPPRVLEGFTDTVYDTVNRPGVRPAGNTNVYAAFPSFHVGWPVAAGVAVGLLFRSRLVWVAALLPSMLVFLAVIVTANHYVVDGFAGGLISLTCLWASHAAGSTSGTADVASVDDHADHRPPDSRRGREESMSGAIDDAGTQR